MLKIEVTRTASEESIHVRMAGEIDAPVAQYGVAALHRALSAVTPPTVIVLDLSDLKALAAAGARSILGFADARVRGGFELRLVADPEGVVTEILRLTSRQAALLVYDTAAAALRLAAPPATSD
ncbi:STAS domain-containing protein [Actinospica acidithermotolerans]|uniref:STAS domain-containing protein n=1 Tax=Actinospica acidithermotolerans TaxID=2828514 RepID=UPI001BA60EC8|nr:STAS domain-containing protein [Actinospica acidithermotolerans]